MGSDDKGEQLRAAQAYAVELEAENADLRARLSSVRDIHTPIDAVRYSGSRSFPSRVCSGCGTDDGNWQMWPCPTVRAMKVEEA